MTHTIRSTRAYPRSKVSTLSTLNHTNSPNEPYLRRRNFDHEEGEEGCVRACVHAYVCVYTRVHVCV